MERYRHKKTGCVYTILARGQMQAVGWVDSWTWPQNDGSFPSVDMADVTVYQGVDGAVWVRPTAEFEDGRFEVVE